MKSKEEVIAELDKRFQALPEREREVIARFHGINRSKQDFPIIMLEMGLSADECQRLYENGLRLLRKP